jgi:ABC-2 type transport system permease protein
MFETELYPVTSHHARRDAGNMSLFLFLIVMFYAGELVWRHARLLDDVIDAMPVPNFVPLAACAARPCWLVVAGVRAGQRGRACMLFQLVNGYTRLEPLLYVKGLALAAAMFVLTGWLAIVLQVISNHKFVGYLLTIGIMMSWLVLGLLHLDHNLVAFAQAPARRIRHERLRPLHRPAGPGSPATGCCSRWPRCWLRRRSGCAARRK